MARQRIRIRPVPDADHLMRFVPYKLQIRDPETDEFKGIANLAFALRPEDDGGLSTQWVEHYGGRSLPSYSAAAIQYRDNLQSKSIGGKGYFAVGNVSLAKQVADTYNKQIRVVHEPDGSNEGHALIRRFTDEDRALLDALALEVFREHIWVGDLDLR